MKLKQWVIPVLTTLMIGCATVPLESAETSNQSKKFLPPMNGNSFIYIYRNSPLGTALKKSIWINDECIGRSAPDTFFHHEVAGNKTYTIATESEFSPNTLSLEVKSGESYFIKQFIKLGVFIGGADLEVVPEEKAKQDILKLDLAKSIGC